MNVIENYLLKLESYNTRILKIALVLYCIIRVFGIIRISVLYTLGLLLLLARSSLLGSATLKAFGVRLLRAATAGRSSAFSTKFSVGILTATVLASSGSLALIHLIESPLALFLLALEV